MCQMRPGVESAHRTLCRKNPSICGTGMKSLFDVYQLGPITLKNRIVMAPLTRSRSGGGDAPRELNAEYYRQRASAGLIITEATQVSRQGQGYLWTPGIYTEQQVE